MRDRVRSIVGGRVAWFIALLALPAILAAGEDRDEVRRGFTEATAPPESESAYARVRDESGPQYEVAGGPVLSEVAEPSEVATPRRPTGEDRLPPEGSETDLGWWRVGLDWRRHPGVCLIDP
jgi:hypothetical protein